MKPFVLFKMHTEFREKDYLCPGPLIKEINLSMVLNKIEGYCYIYKSIGAKVSSSLAPV